jgi:Ca-activated chloride channel family protein
MKTARLSLIALSLVAASAGAQGRLIPRPCPQPVPPPCREGRCPDVAPIRPCIAQNAIVRTSSQVRVVMVNRVLRYEVDETFMNTGGGLGEADYLFPLPAGSAFEDLKLSINGELVSGETMNANEARRIYEDIVRRHRDPALVEWMGAGLLRARIFPINTGEEKRRRGSVPVHCTA